MAGLSHRLRCRVCVGAHSVGHSLDDSPSRAGHNRKFETNMQIKDFYCQSVVFLHCGHLIPTHSASLADSTWYKVLAMIHETLCVSKRHRIQVGAQ